MINSKNFVYSKAAAARILDVPVYAIARFEIWYKVCFIQIKGKRPTFLGKKAFKQHFVDWRIGQSRSLCVAQVNREHFRVVNPKKNTAYSVWAMTDGLDCECEDYKNQVMIFGGGKACCKHAYGVLTWLGFNRLSDYVLANAIAS
jgi:hypothetical protein